MSFPLVPKSVTLHDIDLWPLMAVLLGFAVHRVKLAEAVCSPKTLALTAYSGWRHSLVGLKRVR